MLWQSIIHPHGTPRPKIWQTVLRGNQTSDAWHLVLRSFADQGSAVSESPPVKWMTNHVWNMVGDDSWVRTHPDLVNPIIRKYIEIAVAELYCK
jgi:hypothetical protein